MKARKLGIAILVLVGTITASFFVILSTNTEAASYENLAPSKPSVEFSGGHISGEQVIATLNSVPNPSDCPVDYFMVDVYYEDTGAFILRNAVYDASNNMAIVTFTPLHGATNIVVKASASDISGRPSGYSFNTRYIERSDGGDGKEDGGTPGFEFVLLIGAIGIIIFIKRQRK